MSTYNFTISDSALRSACEFHNIDISDNEDEMILFAIRGALPAAEGISLLDYSDHTKFESEHLLQRVKVNYYYPRCVIGQWLPSERKIAIFPASTVPNLKVVQRNKKKKHQFNCMQPGFYNYRKGQHSGSNSGFQPHRALRLQSKITFRRANFTLQNKQPVIDYGPSAYIGTGNPGDNIHCARNNTRTTKVKALKGQDFSYSFCMSDYYSSYGCQVIVGCPEQYIPRGQKSGNWNAWEEFIGNVYDHFAKEQQNFKYLLIDSFNMQKIAEATSTDIDLIKVVHGSSGPLVKRLQEGLQKMRKSSTGKPYYSGTIDGDFGANTAKALIQFQKDMHSGKAYGYANEATFKSLGMSLATPV
ncbi:peptidoglycan-binding domain-containing protein [Tenacibaculum amylolyticum]|uniref:peptidoglycan-binding domain-containing protein n=1 Tax=Tenacibaculum amylolyticum TaxID=104269 RepID=UPI0038936694